MSEMLKDIKSVIDAVNDDGGYNSRKFRIAIIAMAVILLAGVIAGAFPAFGTQYPSAVWGIVTITVGYMGGNVAAKYVAGKAVSDLAPAVTPATATPPATAPVPTPVAQPPIVAVPNNPPPPPEMTVNVGLPPPAGLPPPSGPP